MGTNILIGGFYMKQAQVSIVYYILFLILLITMTLAISTGVNYENENKYIVITITNGDTLWGINESFKNQHNLSFSEFVSWVESKNNVQHDRLNPGDKLYVPIKMTDDLKNVPAYASNGY